MPHARLLFQFREERLLLKRYRTRIPAIPSTSNPEPMLLISDTRELTGARNCQKRSQSEQVKRFGSISPSIPASGDNQFPPSGLNTPFGVKGIVMKILWAVLFQLRTAARGMLQDNSFCLLLQPGKYQKQQMAAGHPLHHYGFVAINTCDSPMLFSSFLNSKKGESEKDILLREPDLRHRLVSGIPHRAEHHRFEIVRDLQNTCIFL